MSLFNLEKDIPPQKLVKIYMADNKLVTSKPLILDDDLSIKVNSKFGELWQSSSNNFMTLASSLFGIPNGQFTLQGVQIWQSTDPITINIDVDIEMDRDPYEDVIVPVQTLMSLVLPKKSKMVMGNEKSNSNLKISTLIPPGPNVQAIVNSMKDDSKFSELASNLLENFSQGSRGVYNVTIGYVNFVNVIITSAEPTFSKEMSYSTLRQNKLYPVSAKVSLEISTMEMATTDMVATMFN